MAFSFPRTMKAAVLTQLHQPLEIMEVTLPDPGPGQVLVKVAATGICQTQLLEIRGENTIGSRVPNMLGHEGSGIVEEIGVGVTKVKKGDHVILSWIKGSGANILPIPYKSLSGEVPINAGFVTTFNDYCLASENRVTAIPKEMPLKEAALIGCAVATGAGAVFNNAKVKPGQSVMVIGVGGIGINMVHAASLAKASPIIAVDILDSKLELAKRMGATHTINSQREDVPLRIREMVGEEGLDYAFETVGAKQVQELVYNLVKKASGRAVLCGVPKPKGGKIEIDPFPLYFGRQLVGTAGGEVNPDVDFPRFCQMFLDGQLRLPEMITHTFSLQDINRGIEVMKSGDCCRVIIDFPDMEKSAAEQKKKYKVVYDRTNCIGVLTCTSFYPQRWAINNGDSKADLVGGKEDRQQLGIWTTEFTEEELEQFKISAEVCPVNVIHIFDVETGEKII